MLAPTLGFAQRNDAGIPIDIVECERGNFETAKTEIYRAAYDRSDPAHRRARRVQRLEQPLYLFVWKRLW